RYWPQAHMQVLKEIMKIVAKGTPVYYLTGNHDELLRRFSDFRLGNFHLLDQLVLEQGGQKIWFFHGDVFDASMHTKWLAKLGGLGYDWLILVNSLINRLLTRMGKEKMSFSKKVKSKVKEAVSYISDFEQIAAEVAIEQGYQTVVCGHIHQPQMRTIRTEKGSVTYLNSGDWVENLTALEYVNDSWRVFSFEQGKHSIHEFKQKPKPEKKAKSKVKAPNVAEVTLA
ncbi:MAG: UDP-2,3-diacylglucosamine diphosphatase, partial [Bacteroidota bacterium]